ncbi:class D sortase [Neobacillus jeddahensis]|uniref:class D sortase n=1 Tax=Neobacillus jeddahensis TaxID=1461580 RepID=UPI00058CBE89|nr:class D sortase [Neobacillus jeddahensis]
MKAKLPLFIILLGLILLGVGLWQYVDMKVQTKTSLKHAKELVSKPLGDKQINSKEKAAPPEMGDTVGLLTIPKIKAELAIVEGTDPDDLEKGVGHYKGSYFPGDKGQIVLSGHRDTVFRKLGELEIGDSLKIKMTYGSFTYEITHTKIVKSDDTSIITLQKQEEELILTTCYPFRYVGNAPKRYIIYAKLKSS